MLHQICMLLLLPSAPIWVRLFLAFHKCQQIHGARSPPTIPTGGKQTEGFTAFHPSSKPEIVVGSIAFMKGEFVQTCLAKSQRKSRSLVCWLSSSKIFPSRAE